MLKHNLFFEVYCMKKTSTPFLSTLIWGINALFDIFSRSIGLVTWVSVGFAVLCGYLFVTNLIQYHEDKNQ